MVSFWGEGGVEHRGGDQSDHSGQQGQAEEGLEGLGGALEPDLSTQQNQYSFLWVPAEHVVPHPCIHWHLTLAGSVCAQWSVIFRPCLAFSASQELCCSTGALGPDLSLCQREI